MNVLRLTLSTEPIRGHVNKFGGQPVWVGAAQWPMSRSLNKPMRFICQIAIADPSMMGGQRMAYVFMTDEQEAHVERTYEASGGENAVILQPGPFNPIVSTRNSPTGPTLTRNTEQPRSVMDRLRGIRRVVRQDIEFVVSEQVVEPTEENQLQSHIGGEPFWLQSDETPGDGEWRFLMQIDSATVPFEINFGDAGVAYVFAKTSGTEACMFWQCC